jgi:hypothetical protein
MVWVACEETTAILTKTLNDPAVHTRLRKLREAGASAGEYRDLLIAAMDPAAASVAASELRELPALTTVALVEAWAMADAAGKPFKVVSERPARPLEYARKRQVTLAVHTDSSGVTVGISHIANRHDSWYAPSS